MDNARVQRAGCCFSLSCQGPDRIAAFRVPPFFKLPHSGHTHAGTSSIPNTENTDHPCACLRAGRLLRCSRAAREQRHTHTPHTNTRGKDGRAVASFLLPYLPAPPRRSAWRMRPPPGTGCVPGLNLMSVVRCCVVWGWCDEPSKQNQTATPGRASIHPCQSI